MATRKKKTAVALTRCGNTMSESTFLAWIRSALRSKSLKWPPRGAALVAARRPYKGPNKLQKWEYRCSLCDTWSTAKGVCVDHFPKPAGSILSVADIGEFANNLYCEVENLRVLCVPCHAVHTLAEKKQITFEEAKLEKQVTELLKDKKKTLDLLAKEGYTGSTVSNEAKRRALLTQLLKEKQNG